jgi:hypothetical protein
VREGDVDPEKNRAIKRARSLVKSGEATSFETAKVHHTLAHRGHIDGNRLNELQGARVPESHHGSATLVSGEPLCYTFSMKRTRQRRAGSTETFSVSVDPETKKALRALADSAYGGNLSALVTDFAADARRRLAAGAYLKRHGVPEATAQELDKIEAELAAEVAAWKKRRKGRRVA